MYLEGRRSKGQFNKAKNYFGSTFLLYFFIVYEKEKNFNISLYVIIFVFWDAQDIPFMVQ